MKRLLITALAMALAGNIYAATPISKNFYTDTGHGKPIVLIHAFPADHHLWQPQIKSLSKHYRIITIDLQGFGNAPLTDGTAVSMQRYAERVKQLLDQLHIKKAIIGGESMGGYVSLAFLKAYPAMTAGLILGDTQAVRGTEAVNSQDELEAEDVLENGTSKLVSNFVPKAVSKNASEETKQFLTKMFLSQSSTGMASGLRGIASREDTTPELKATKVPVLIITGDLDEVVPTSESHVMHKEAKNSKLVVIHNAGHLTNVERPREWNHAVEKFFQ